jgi:hypothetical protein
METGMKRIFLKAWNVAALWSLLLVAGFLVLRMRLPLGPLLLALIPATGAAAAVVALVLLRRETVMLSRTLLLAAMGLLTGLGLDLTAVTLALLSGAGVSLFWVSLLGVLAGFGAFAFFARNRLRVGAVITALALLTAFLALQLLAHSAGPARERPSANSAVQGRVENARAAILEAPGPVAEKSLDSARPFLYSL